MKKIPSFNLKAKDIVDVLKKAPQPLEFIEIAKALKVAREYNTELSKLIFSCENMHHIEKNREGKYFALQLVESGFYSISLTNKRLGFIDFSETQSALLLPFQLNNVLDKDIVHADIYSYEQDNKTLYRAFINYVREHTKKNIVGKFVKGINVAHYFFEGFDEKDRAKYFLRALANDFEYKTDELVVAKVLSPKANGSKVDVEFEKYLGKIDNPRVIEQKIISQNNIDIEFAAETLISSKALPQSVQPQDFEGRKDLRSLFTTTIDGDDTKDYDDAISCQKNPDGTYKLWVHIADVSYYVKENDDIDKEALQRGTSIYLPDRVIPMLPFELSNGICSLNPNEERCAMTLELFLDSQGHNISYEVYPSIIKSNYRLTYSKVNEYYQSKHSFDTETEQFLDIANEISQLIRANKNAEGYVDFEIEESKVIMEGDKVVDIVIKKSGQSEMMIEDFMVRANETIATMMRDKKIPSIYRIHDKPDAEKIFNLQQVLNFLNINANLKQEPTSRDFANVIDKIKAQNHFDDFVKSHLLRSLQKAKYSEVNIGHFGLASDCYSHFTSPIRRYPDLLLHRLIRNFVFTNQKLTDEQNAALEAKINEISALNSESETIAMTIERDVVDLKKAEFFEQFVGKKFKVRMISCEKFGIFFELSQYKTSILLRFEDISREIVSQISSLEAKGTTLSFKSDNEYEIVIASVDTQKGQINALLPEDWMAK
ncbi:ribonuclease R [[Mycoplasma] gypis]|uniref:Ribonuclease R n=1 Tax=[Mycoplasma] gypis TaxID=92404 RepID=A0ABZ2RNQ6_9BACT|nr:ribonuclease R [[Mycoplasma] gypis]MBN0919301.1 ribonuclease R [[Mycoplasma] gypis]